MAFWLDIPLPGKISYLPGLPAAWGRPCGTAPPTNEAKYMAQFHAWACEAGLCLPGLAGFWLSKKEVWLWLAGFLVGHPPTWKNLVLTWLKLAGPPRCLGAALWRHCPSHKRSKVDGTIPRVGLRSSPGVDRLGRREKGWTINSLQGPGCLAKSGLCLPGLAGYQKKRFGWLLAGFWLAFWLDIPLPGKISYVPG